MTVDELPPNWEDLPWPELQKLARELSGRSIGSRAEAHEAIIAALKGKGREIKPAKLLCDRQQSAEILDCSLSTIHRLEKAGKLTRVRLLGEGGKVHHRLEQVYALAMGDQ